MHTTPLGGRWPAGSGFPLGGERLPLRRFTRPEVHTYLDEDAVLALSTHSAQVFSWLVRYEPVATGEA